MSLPANDTAALALPEWVKDSVYLDPSNPFTAAKASLGRYFFYDRRLSVNQTKSCASCHAPQFSFTDSYRRSIGALGDNVQYNAPPLINLVYNRYLTWADSSLHFPEQQIRNPMFHTSPVELGWEGHEADILQRIQVDTLYSGKLPALFPGDSIAFTTKHVQDCISSFVKTIVSLAAPYDRFVQTHDSSLLSREAWRGSALFNSALFACGHCHGGINFNRTDNTAYQLNGSYSTSFRVPTLRNLRFTAPYLHDGSVNTLEELLDKHVNELGKKNRQLAMELTAVQRNDLIHFLYSLSDSSVLNKPAYSNPFTFDETKQSRQD
jgi:cytochrome c peroxidase